MDDDLHRWILDQAARQRFVAEQRRHAADGGFVPLEDG